MTLAGALRDRLRAAGELSALFTSALGRRVEVEAGAEGVLVYASSRDDAERSARTLLRAVRERDARAALTGPERDPGEPAETTWWAEVTFDWRRI